MDNKVHFHVFMDFCMHDVCLLLLVKMRFAVPFGTQGLPIFIISYMKENFSSNKYGPSKVKGSL